MSTRSLLLASAACICAGLAAAGALIAGSSAFTGGPAPIRHAVAIVMPIPNTQAKSDRLPSAPEVTSSAASDRFAPPSDWAVQEPTTAAAPQAAPALALASEPPPNTKIGPPIPFVSQPPGVQPKPRPQAAKRQGAYALLSDEQIASIKERMKLTPSQQVHWPAIETALRKIANRVHKTNPSGVEPVAASIDPNSPEVQDLKNAAFPLLFTLSEDQKREVRTLARVIGLNAVAEAI